MGSDNGEIRDPGTVRVKTIGDFQKIWDWDSRSFPLVVRVKLRDGVHSVEGVGRVPDLIQEGYECVLVRETSGIRMYQWGYGGPSSRLIPWGDMQWFEVEGVSRQAPNPEATGDVFLGSLKEGELFAIVGRKDKRYGVVLKHGWMLPKGEAFEFCDSDLVYVRRLGTALGDNCVHTYPRTMKVSRVAPVSR